MRRAARRIDAGCIAVSPWALRPRDDAGSRARLRDALALPKVIVTSPAAARAAAALQPLRAGRGQQWFAVGAGTAAALRRAGVAEVSAPARMDTEGLLDMPDLRDVSDQCLALVTAPGGRGELAPALEARGATILRADVYERVPLPPAPRAVQALRALVVPAVVALSSGEALTHVCATWPPDVVARLRACPVVAASDRLATIARDQGFTRVHRAEGPRPAQLVAAAGQAVRIR
ncbi:uroporphyrinogen-III synthase [Lysobacter ruishenii]|uniref:Uroporphyrinogen-III synthase n=2 Tax=Aerolutibacter ruishenii TaxID=686800 RepID=A0A562M184_9GAMM|nr:uroporphyrinogen-III synthase [Lysobacter ruishenii]TWI13548.1 uroporphyrinogen-III synthase [Lysobacter ruishenii]